MASTTCQQRPQGRGGPSLFCTESWNCCALLEMEGCQITSSVRTGSLCHSSSVLLMALTVLLQTLSFCMEYTVDKWLDGLVQPMEDLQHKVLILFCGIFIVNVLDKVAITAIPSFVEEHNLPLVFVVIFAWPSFVNHMHTNMYIGIRAMPNSLWKKKIILVDCFGPGFIAWKCQHALDPAHLVQDPVHSEVAMELQQQAQLGRKVEFCVCPVMFPIRKLVFASNCCEIPQPVVAHHRAKLSCCSQYEIFGPASQHVDSCVL